MLKSKETHRLYKFKDFEADLIKTIESEWKIVCGENQNAEVLKKAEVFIYFSFSVI